MSKFKTFVRTRSDYHEEPTRRDKVLVAFGYSLAFLAIAAGLRLAFEIIQWVSR